DEDLGLEEEGGGRAQPGGTGADLEAGVGAVERLALLAGEELGEGLGVGLDGVGRAAEQLAALLVAAGGPLRLDPTGRRDGGVEVRGGVLGRVADELTGGRVEDLPTTGGDDGGEQPLVAQRGEGGVLGGGHGLPFRRWRAGGPP